MPTNAPTWLSRWRVLMIKVMALMYGMEVEFTKLAKRMGQGRLSWFASQVYRVAVQQDLAHLDQLWADFETTILRGGRLPPSAVDINELDRSRGMCPHRNIKKYSNRESYKKCVDCGRRWRWSQTSKQWEVYDAEDAKAEARRRRSVTSHPSSSASQASSARVAATGHTAQGSPSRFEEEYQFPDT